MTVNQDELCAAIGAEFATRPVTVEPATELLLSGLVDSLGVVRIVQWIEERYGLRVDPAEVTLDHFESVAAMTSFIETKQAVPADSVGPQGS